MKVGGFSLRICQCETTYTCLLLGIYVTGLCLKREAITLKSDTYSKESAEGVKIQSALFLDRPNRLLFSDLFILLICISSSDI